MSRKESSIAWFPQAKTSTSKPGHFLPIAWISVANSGRPRTIGSMLAATCGEASTGALGGGGAAGSSSPAGSSWRRPRLHLETRRFARVWSCLPPRLVVLLVPRLAPLRRQRRTPLVVRWPASGATPSAQWSAKASAMSRSASPSASSNDRTQRTSSVFLPCIQHHGSCQHELASASVGTCCMASARAFRSMSLCRRIASRKRKALASPLPANDVRCKCRKTRFRKLGSDAMRVKCCRPKRNSSALRVIQ
mmetsp:Transcript_8444/g.24266  ORF Transcript_8444/g.24266 Transcript_8444/m.24266 type:complete len:250 (+) Transcript_8444:423-1172(+)